MTPLQRRVADFNATNRLSLDLNSRILDLVSEVGEVAKLAFTQSTQTHVSMAEWETELGDTLYSLLSLMVALDVEAESALESVLRKYESRMAKRSSPASEDD